MDGFEERAEAEDIAGFGRGAPQIVAVGVGGAAGRVLGVASKEWRHKPMLAAVDTDAAALGECGVEYSIAVGRNVANGFGAGGEGKIGRMAAEEDEEALRELVAGRKLLLLVAGLGGGAGAGIAPALARLARQENVLTVALVTMPYEFEGERRHAVATEALAAMKESCDAVVVISNQQIRSLLPEGTPIAQLHGRVDRMLLAGVNALWNLAGQTTMMNLDFSDLQSLVENSPNQCGFAFGEGEGEGRVERLLAMLLDERLTDSRQALSNAGALILCVTGGDDLTVSETERIRDAVKGSTRAGAEIKMSVAVLPERRGRVEATVFTAERWSRTPAGGGGKGAPGQGELVLSYPAEDDRGLFKGSEQDLYNGTDLDLPTFIRQGVKIPT